MGGCWMGYEVLIRDEGGHVCTGLLEVLEKDETLYLDFPMSTLYPSLCQRRYVLSWDIWQARRKEAV